MNAVDDTRNDPAVLQCLRDVVDLDVVQNVVELGLVVGATRHETTIVVSLKETSEQSVVQGVLAALETVFPDVANFNIVSVAIDEIEADLVATTNARDRLGPPTAPLSPVRLTQRCPTVS